ncbi:MAG: DEAD/DEAH box helicase family protein [Clostridia bacterium]|nr:DEAD/DEAH box helicase family protein [Clostridia bacterium]
MKEEYIKKFYNEVSQALQGDYKIILEPNRELTDDWIEYDQVKWELEDSIQNLVDKLVKDKSMELEDKILSIYNHICLNYVYDGNVLYFFRRDESDINNIKYIAVDWYGRIVGPEWIEKRKKHNRRICYEFSRLFAKAINEILKPQDKLEAFMIGDKENLHYSVGLTGEEYSIILDLDDFNKLKDLTRLKLGLTLEGIKVLRDNSGKFQKCIDKFNENKLKELVEVEELKKLRGKDDIKYFNNILKILNDYDIDPQGIFEYMRIIIENEEFEIEKIWKEVNGDGEKRYARCLIFNFDSKTYLLDSVDKTLNEINKERLDKKVFIFNPEENEYPYYGG